MNSAKKRNVSPSRPPQEARGFLHFATMQVATAICAALLLMSALSYSDATPVALPEDEDAARELLQTMQLDPDLLKDLPYILNEDDSTEVGGLDMIAALSAKLKNSREIVPTDEHVEQDEDVRQARSVIGDDERLPVEYSDKLSGLPFCAIGQMANGCTAFLVSPYHAITSAQCVYNLTSGQFYPRAAFNLYRGRSCNTEGAPMLSRGAIAPFGYTGLGNNSWNFALVAYTTDRPSPCYMSFSADPYITWPNQGFDVIGYPYDQYPDERPNCTYATMTFSSCHYSLSILNGNYYAYRCDTSDGTVGAPLLGEFQSTSNTQRIAFGVNILEGLSYNYGTRFDREKFCAIVDWAQRYTSYTFYCGSVPCCQ